MNIEEIIVRRQSNFAAMSVEKKFKWHNKILNEGRVERITACRVLDKTPLEMKLFSLKELDRLADISKRP